MKESEAIKIYLSIGKKLKTVEKITKWKSSLTCADNARNLGITTECAFIFAQRYNLKYNHIGRGKYDRGSYTLET